MGALRVRFLRDAAEKRLPSIQYSSIQVVKYSAKACAFSTLLLVQVPCDVLRGGEVF
jgi:hypothetical protein